MNPEVDVMKRCPLAAMAVIVSVASGQGPWSGVTLAALGIGQRQLCISFTAEPHDPPLLAFRPTFLILDSEETLP